MKIYTKKGDAGQTYLFGGGPYPKDAERIEAYGTLDELNSALGMAAAQLAEASLQVSIQQVQQTLFVIGSELAAVNPTPALSAGFIQFSQIDLLEQQIDQWEAQLNPLTQFILPGGSGEAAALHFARALCRRAERRVVSLSHDFELRPEILAYLNRLSDWLFVLARFVNRRLQVPDILWGGVRVSDL